MIKITQKRSNKIIEEMSPNMPGEFSYNSNTMLPEGKAHYAVRFRDALPFYRMKK